MSGEMMISPRASTVRSMTMMVFLEIDIPDDAPERGASGRGCSARAVSRSRSEHTCGGRDRSLSRFEGRV